MSGGKRMSAGMLTLAGATPVRRDEPPADQPAAPAPAPVSGPAGLTAGAGSATRGDARTDARPRASLAAVPPVHPVGQADGVDRVQALRQEDARRAVVSHLLAYRAALGQAEVRAQALMGAIGYAGELGVTIEQIEALFVVHGVPAGTILGST